jgi:hypothetical protein
MKEVLTVWQDTRIVALSLPFGPAAARASLEDGDGDIVVRFRGDAGFARGDNTAKLVGETTAGGRDALDG